MIVNSRNPYEVEKAVDYLHKLLEKECVFELKEKKPIRSNQQNAYLHVILGYFASQYGCSLDEAKGDFYKRAANREIFEITVTNKKGREIKTLRSSASLDSREMTTSIERFRNWSSAVANIYLPSPNEEQFLAYCQREIEDNAEFV